MLIVNHAGVLGMILASFATPTSDSQALADAACGGFINKIPYEIRY
jgi:hypothetical protein